MRRSWESAQDAHSDPALRQPPATLRKDIPACGVQLLQDVFQLAEGDALLTGFQPIQRGGRDADLASEHGVAGVTPPLA
jgi:hypothetical protein